MVQDIRMAGLDPLGTANAGISDAITAELPTTDWIEYTADVNFDGEIKENEDYERIRYRLDGKQLKQRNRMEEEVLLDNVTNLTFTYLNSDDDPTTDFNEIRSVEVSLTMEKPAGRAGTISRTYTTKVRCRNL
jgi:hypothetical protein